jgi:hypothetical protein
MEDGKVEGKADAVLPALLISNIVLSSQHTLGSAQANGLSTSSEQSIYIYT